MSRTKNKWAIGVSKKNKKGFTTGFASLLNGHVSRKNRLDHKIQLYANGGFMNCRIVRCGDTPAYKWGKPERCDCSDRNHMFKKCEKRNYRNYLKNEARTLINSALNELDN